MDQELRLVKKPQHYWRSNRVEESVWILSKALHRLALFTLQTICTPLGAEQWPKRVAEEGCAPLDHTLPRTLVKSWYTKCKQEACTKCNLQRISQQQQSCQESLTITSVLQLATIFKRLTFDHSSHRDHSEAGVQKVPGEHETEGLRVKVGLPRCWEGWHASQRTAILLNKTIPVTQNRYTNISSRSIRVGK